MLSWGTSRLRALDSEQAEPKEEQVGPTTEVSRPECHRPWGLSFLFYNKRGGPFPATGSNPLGYKFNIVDVDQDFKIEYKRILRVEY